MLKMYYINIEIFWATLTSPSFGLFNLNTRIVTTIIIIIIIIIMCLFVTNVRGTEIQLSTNSC